jgi:hypothetical protein
VEKSQYELCASVLRRLDDAGVLPEVVIVGSWCVLFYERYFNTAAYRASIRTRDLDIAIPLPPRFGHKVDIAAQLAELGFVTDFKGRGGYVRFLHPELIVEFLVPERGRGSDKPFDVPKLGINAQPLRFLDMLLAETISVPFQSVSVRLPHPANFALHKLLISGRRHSDKAERDREQAVSVMRALKGAGQENRLRGVFAALPPKWKAQIMRAIEITGDVASSALPTPPSGRH